MTYDPTCASVSAMCEMVQCVTLQLLAMPAELWLAKFSVFNAKKKSLRLSYAYKSFFSCVLDL